MRLSNGWMNFLERGVITIAGAGSPGPCKTQEHFGENGGTGNPSPTPVF